MIRVKKDLTGMRFGRLVVISQNEEDRIYPSGRRAAKWNCYCDCGNDCVVIGWYLTNGDTKSCGCLNKEIAAKRGSDMWKKYNTYDLSGEYGIGYTESGEEFWFDKEDYDLIEPYYWYYNGNGYVSTSPTHGPDILLHRLVMNVKDGIVIDHKEHPHGKAHKVDNRKSNLRYATDSQNAMNRHIHSNNTSGVTGVGWNKDSQKWCAYICKNYEQIHLGYFDNFDDAVRARKDAEGKYFGEYAYKNSEVNFPKRKETCCEK